MPGMPPPAAFTNTGPPVGLIVPEPPRLGDPVALAPPTVTDEVLESELLTSNVPPLTVVEPV